MRTLVTGGAGFIGSHLVDALLDEGNHVTALDNLTSGLRTNIEALRVNPRFRFIEADLKTAELSGLLREFDVVYHFAANPEVRIGEQNPRVHFDENLVSTFRVLDGMRLCGSRGTVVLASTSTIYGETNVMPTPEDYGPTIPISTYGASKLGCEALVSSFAYTYGLRGLILRYGNIVGSRSHHGIIPDLVKKLQSNREELEILGDGTQRKSYLHITDCVSATMLLTGKFLQSTMRVDVYNVSSPDQVGVRRIAEIVAAQMGVPSVALKFSGGVDGGRGWLGDVKLMQLSISKLSKLGWIPNYSSEDAICAAAKEIAREARTGK